MNWDDFADGLVAELPYLNAGTLLVISEEKYGGNGRYAQFSQEDDELISEVSANKYLDEQRSASVEGERLIRAAGRALAAPGAGENWTTTLKWPAPRDKYRALAEMIVAALRDGYGIESPDGWRYRAWNDRRGNAPVELKRLGLLSN